MVTEDYSIVIVPGLGGSEPDHWQSKWEVLHPEFIRCEQDDWNDPLPEHWVSRLEETVTKCSKPVILVAHSLGCVTSLKWLQQTSHTISAIMLVAPADVEADGCVSELLPFSPIPTAELQVPAVVVASENDQYMSITRSQYFAEIWRTSFINVGRLGHINAESGLGDWNDGLSIFQDLLDEVRSIL